MNVSDSELRAMVREAIARHSEPGGAVSPPLLLEACRQHVSHGRLPVLRGGDDDGACLIEPAVRCNHCGFCQSFGH
jgi:hypothetical protein